MGDKASKPAEAAPVEPEATRVTDGWITWGLALLFALACVITWWLAHRSTPPGAPGAPVG